MTERTCIHCGSAFHPVQGTQKYCQPLCKYRSLNDRRRADGRLRQQRKKYAKKRAQWMRENYREKRTCSWCCDEYLGPRGIQSKYCSMICYGASVRGGWPASAVPWRSCPDCGNTRIERGTVSPRCRDCRTPKRPVFVGGDCAWCGSEFVVASFSGEARYCSKRCLTKWHRARRSSSRFVITPVARAAVYERDAWACQLCHEPIDRDAGPLDDWAPSLDHIVPQSKGGGHGPENLRLAHRWCNAVRGDDTYYTAADLAA